IVIPRRLGSRALHPLPPPARPSAKLSPRPPADTRPRNAGTRDLNARDASIRNAKDRNSGTRNLDMRTAKARDASASSINAPLVTRDLANSHDINNAYTATLRDNIEMQNIAPVRVINPRNTDTVQNRSRTTEEPIKRTHRSAHVAIFTGIVVPIVLLVLLIMPRVLGISIF